jgi:hypothetical protein
MTGEWPTEVIDHINGNRAEDRWTNLRACTVADNACNRGAQSNNTSGVKGVSWNKKAGKWEVHVSARGNNAYLGLYKTLEQATKVAQETREIWHKEYAKHK